ncbi:GFA family protein [Solemya velum gill symbiont]|uniref:Aldehyde-activating protein n=1 Tax=Solemya velum gill symbiont TaxID=2340 RepID=A0A0B0H9L0_SOVGS|nr:GFA family protein [Solemya velum gill symbiont]KHF25327.1 hypothetical protein JV46_06500 [Solemya velum gill symbiont]OOY35135.1 aldehyde-activating protein [Solemya velum gill symbiont]OOY37848.1 aldehyde-activating protein [Solemya velum gill symbiont]OOY41143.1 aldehyde-activating protein [Solemya velum gill symbiont]OOY41429.1 aldehyde-activating protein [Solemya velum gill symbiont]
MTTYHGSCHCGAVTFSFECDPIEKGIRCNCSICARKGVMMTPEVIPPERFHIDSGEENLGVYQFGSGVAKHYFCKTCGIHTFNMTLRAPGQYRANLGCVDEVDEFKLECDVFDGKHLL